MADSRAFIPRRVPSTSLQSYALPASSSLRRSKTFSITRFFQWRATWLFAGFIAAHVYHIALGLHVQYVQHNRIAAEELKQGHINKNLPSNMLNLRPRFVLFGDSLTQQSFRSGGWGAALQNHYSREADVVVRGYGGYNTRWALNLLDKIFPKDGHVAPPTLVTIFFGANDAALPDRNSQRQHVPIPEYKANLQKIIAHIKAISPSTKIILMTPPPVDEEGRLAYARETYGEKAVRVPERENRVAQLYAQACIDVANSEGVAALDLWTAVQQEPNWQKLLNDGLHFTPEGNQVVFRQLLAVIEEKSRKEWRPSLIANDMAMDFPHHSNIDSGDPGRAFRSTKSVALD